MFKHLRKNSAGQGFWGQGAEAWLAYDPISKPPEKREEPDSKLKQRPVASQAPSLGTGRGCLGGEKIKVLAFSQQVLHSSPPVRMRT